jgi:GNAT superfamily N-acetyltransferase
MLEPRSISVGAHAKVAWRCDCGKVAHISAKSVINGNTKSCGRCNEISAEEMATRKFGKLRLKDPCAILPGSNKELEWLCDCGRTTIAQPNSVVRGNIKSCGNCFSVARSWWERNRTEIRVLKCPIAPANIPFGFVALETVQTTKRRFASVCQCCGRKKMSAWGDIRQGRALTCGCSHNNILGWSTRISALLAESGVYSILEHKVGKLKYDVFIPSANLLLEVNGLRWHKGDAARRRDCSKRDVALANNHQFMMVFEDEVRRHTIDKLLLNRVGRAVAESVRPRQCTISKIATLNANNFHAQFHYLGKCASPAFSYGASFDGKLVAVASFGRPTRQASKCEFELLRMASDPDYRVHGIWGQLLREFVREVSPRSIVSFSDNRLFDGRVYPKIGFAHDGDVKPDYYWTDGYKRWHKSSLRKTPDEVRSGKTEVALRTAEGLDQIWDLGKKRWVWHDTFSSTSND